MMSLRKMAITPSVPCAFMPRDEKGQILAALALVGQLGFIMVTCVLMGLVAGLFLDSLAGTGFAFAPLLLLLGIGAGMLVCYRMIMKAVSGDGKSKSKD